LGKRRKRKILPSKSSSLRPAKTESTLVRSPSFTPQTVLPSPPCSSISRCPRTYQWERCRRCPPHPPRLQRPAWPREGPVGWMERKEEQREHRASDATQEWKAQYPRLCLPPAGDLAYLGHRLLDIDGDLFHPGDSNDSRHDDDVDGRGGRRAGLCRTGWRTRG